MTTYTTIPDSDIDTDSPITQQLMTLLRDNPIATAEGAAGAPPIQRGAFDSAVLLEWFFDYGTGADGAKTVTADESPTNLSYHYTTYEISSASPLPVVTAADGILIIRATTSITINSKIDAKGLGASGGTGRSTDGNGQQGGGGDLGGSGGGGGGSTNTYTGGVGGSTFQTAGGSGGAVDTPGSVGSSQSTAARNLYYDFQNFLSIDGGGGGGAGGRWSTGTSGSGGDGGGVIILIAPIITIGTGGIIDADGTDGTAAGDANSGNGGGGSGGLILAVTPSGGYTDNSSGGVHAAAGSGSTGTGFNGGDGAAGYVENYII